MKKKKSETNNSTINNEDPLTFTKLNETINDNSNSTIYLSNNYKYNNNSDSNFQEGILINRNLTINGNGVTLDGNMMARIFKVSNLNLNVKFYNINFINGLSDYGGAIYQANAYNCTFTNNTGFNGGVNNSGGAIYKGNAYNCRFINNNAGYYGGAISEGNAYNCTFKYNLGSHGGAILNGNAYNCIFTNNTGYDGGALRYGNAYNCTFTKNSAEHNGGALDNGDSINCIFNYNNATKGQAIYQGNAILCIFNGNTNNDTKIIPSTINVLNYTSTYGSGKKLNFNLTADDMVFDGFNTTIKIYKNNILYTTVYGLTGEGWIVNLKPGKYIAELSLTLYPDEKPSNVTINVLKGSSKIISRPVTTTYNINKYLVITLKDFNNKPIKKSLLTINIGNTKKYKTNNKGQVKINVGSLIPKKYKVKIIYAGSDIFKGSTLFVKVTVKKATPKITAKTGIYKLKVKTKKYTVIFKDNENKALKNTKLTLKINGKTYTTKTNYKGQAVFKITNLKKKGSYIAVIFFPGNKIYNKATKKVKIYVIT